jgi:hypothetical protein
LLAEEAALRSRRARASFNSCSSLLLNHFGGSGRPRSAIELRRTLIAWLAAEKYWDFFDAWPQTDADFDPDEWAFAERVRELVAELIPEKLPDGEGRPGAALG